MQSHWMRNGICERHICIKIRIDVGAYSAGVHTWKICARFCVAVVFLFSRGDDMECGKWRVIETFKRVLISSTEKIKKKMKKIK